MYKIEIDFNRLERSVFNTAFESVDVLHSDELHEMQIEREKTLPVTAPSLCLLESVEIRSVFPFTVSYLAVVLAITKIRFAFERELISPDRFPTNDRTP